MTGAKYRNLGKEYNPPFNENGTLNKNIGIFTERGITATAY